MTDYLLHLPRAALDAVVPSLLAHPGRIARGELRVARLGERIDFLVRRLLPGAEGQHEAAGDGLTVAAVEDASAFTAWCAAQVRRRTSGFAEAFALMGLEPGGVVHAATLTDGGTLRPISELRLPGAGMHAVPTAGGAPLYAGRSQPLPGERWSRLAGALGEGAWQRLAALQVAVVGVGRNGSLAATTLVRMGVRRVALIDPDRLELHNLDAMEGPLPANLGATKVAVVGNSIRAVQGTGGRVMTLDTGIATPMAMRLAREADVLVCCTDDGLARLVTALLAAAYQRVLLDIGSGVHREAHAWHAGGDIRLLLPGENRCLACFGGIADTAAARAALAGGPRQTREWREERAGSLRSLNQLNVHLGIRLLEDLVAERISSSTWLQLRYGGDGIPRIDNLPPRSLKRCAGCPQLGAGDAVLGHEAEHLRSWLARVEAGGEVGGGSARP